MKHYSNHKNRFRKNGNFYFIIACALLALLLYCRNIHHTASTQSADMSHPNIAATYDASAHIPPSPTSSNTHHTASAQSNTTLQPYAAHADMAHSDMPHLDTGHQDTLQIDMPLADTLHSDIDTPHDPDADVLHINLSAPHDTDTGNDIPHAPIYTHHVTNEPNTNVNSLLPIPLHSDAAQPNLDHKNNNQTLESTTKLPSNEPQSTSSDISAHAPTAQTIPQTDLPAHIITSEHTSDPATTTIDADGATLPQTPRHLAPPPNTAQSLPQIAQLTPDKNSSRKATQQSSLPAHNQKMVRITNNIAPEMLQYKHWTGKYSPTKFLVTANGIPLEPGQTTSVMVTNNKLDLHFEHEFMNGKRSGDKTVPFTLKDGTTAINLTFSWKEDDRFIIEEISS